MLIHINSIARFFLVFLATTGIIAAQVQEAPSWARGMVWYLIMPDRFENADTENDATTSDLFGDETVSWSISSWTDNWYKRSVEEVTMHDSFYPAALLRQYGGDFEGIRRRLDYLDSLGVTGIILTPVFKARSSHKFDFGSLHHMDPRFGPVSATDTTYIQREIPHDPMSWYFTSADREFMRLLAEIKRRGMRVLLTTQFVHCGVDFWAFRDLLEKQEKSAYASWFTVYAWDKPETPFHSEFSYEKMWNIDAFPRFRQDTLGLVQGPREYVFAATRRWMDPDGDGDPSDGIDGWCVDLTSELPVEFWKQWAEHCRSINPEVLLVNLGKGNGLSAAPFDIDMPSRFGSHLHDFVLGGRVTSTEFDASMMRLRSRTTLSGSDTQFNLIDSHETDRIASMCVNVGLPYDQRNTVLENASYLIRKPTEHERELQRMILLLQFTLPGAPVIYYGNEAGMWGADDPDNRKPMLWPGIKHEPEVTYEVNGDPTAYPVVFDSSLFEYYRTLIQLRKRHFSLKTGDVQTLLLDDVHSLYAFMRSSGSEKIFIVVNAGEETQVCTLTWLGLPDGVMLVDPIHDVSFHVHRDSVTLVLPPRKATILVPKI